MDSGDRTTRGTGNLYRMDLAEIARRQHGAATHAQALASGLSSRQVSHRLATARWQRLHRGVYVLHNGPLTWLARASGAVLYAGRGAALTSTSAAFMWGLESRPPPVIRVAVPATRTVTRPPGLRVVRRRSYEVASRRNLLVTTVAQTLLDLTAEPGCSIDETVALLGKAVQRKLTTVDVIATALDARPRHPQRRLLAQVIEDVRTGVESALEGRVLTNVIRAHGLPGFVLQVPADDSGHRRDAVNDEFGVVVEADGQVWHDSARFGPDRSRDRQTAAEGKVTLRVTWADATYGACWAAVDIGRTLRSRGWTGVPVACSPTCPVNRVFRAVANAS